MSIVIMGIDPGKNGGLAFIEYKANGTKNVAAMKMPVLSVVKNKKIISFIAVKHLMETMKVNCIGIEKVGAMPKQGVVSMFNFGFDTGVLHGLMTGLEKSFIEVTPQSWKSKVLRGLAWKENKACSIQYVQQRFPEVNLVPEGCRKPHDGIADAICIAEYVYANEYEAINGHCLVGKEG